MKNLFDTHNHCQFSFDGKRTTVEESAESAYLKGLFGICFTDHFDFYAPDVESEEVVIMPQIFDISAQQAEISRVQGLYEGGFKVLKGIEVGLNENSRNDTAAALDGHNFDQIIASIHYLEDCDPYHGHYYDNKDFRQAYGLYLETLFNEAVILKNFDILGHYDYVARYAPYPQDSVRYEDFPDIFDTMFRYLVENGKGLEINTKSCKVGRGRKTMLDTNVLSRYRELGGEIITLGSDSHDAANVAEGFAYHAQLLKSLGFRWTSHYEKRQLVQLPL